jgi:hypothetical protein
MTNRRNAVFDTKDATRLICAAPVSVRSRPAGKAVSALQAMFVPSIAALLANAPKRAPFPLIMGQ